MVKKAANSNILLQKQNCFREQVSHVQIFLASKNFYFDQDKLLFRLIAFSQKREMDRDKKLNSILRRHYSFIVTALGENIFPYWASSRFATPPNTEYIFSQLAVIIKP